MGLMEIPSTVSRQSQTSKYALALMWPQRRLSRCALHLGECHWLFRRWPSCRLLRPKTRNVYCKHRRPHRIRRPSRCDETPRLDCRTYRPRRRLSHARTIGSVMLGPSAQSCSDHRHSPTRSKSRTLPTEAS